MEDPLCRDSQATTHLIINTDLIKLSPQNFALVLCAFFFSRCSISFSIVETLMSYLNRSGFITEPAFVSKSGWISRLYESPVFHSFPTGSDIRVSNCFVLWYCGGSSLTKYFFTNFLSLSWVFSCTPFNLLSWRYFLIESILAYRAYSAFSLRCRYFDSSTPTPAHSPHPWRKSTWGIFYETYVSTSWSFSFSNSSRAYSGLVTNKF